MATKKGIDVSSHQGEIDWTKVKASGVDFAIIRAGYGNDISQKDAYFDRNIKEAQKVGIPTGAYWFSYAVSEEDARKEAKVFQEVLKGYKLAYPVYYDFEYDSVDYAKKQGVAITKAKATAFARAFLEEMRKAGYYAGNYTNVDFYLNYFDQEKLKDYALWLASWGVQKPNYTTGLWQYADNGKVDGIQGNVDMNYAYTDYVKTIQEQGMNGFKRPEQKPVETPTGTKEKSATTTDVVNMRKEAHTQGKILTTVGKNETVICLADDGWGWSQVRYQNVIGWMSNRYLKGSGLSGYKTGICNGSDVRVRKTPDLNGVIQKTIQKGKTFEIVCILPTQWLHVILDGEEGYLYYDPSYISVQ